MTSHTERRIRAKGTGKRSKKNLLGTRAQLTYICPVFVPPTTKTPIMGDNVTPDTNNIPPRNHMLTEPSRH